MMNHDVGNYLVISKCMHVLHVIILNRINIQVLFRFVCDAISDVHLNPGVFIYALRVHKSIYMPSCTHVADAILYMCADIYL